MPSLTKRAVDALQPDDAGQDRFLWDTGDGAIKGFGVRMKPSGSASFLVQYRNREGRTRRLVLGKVGVLTPAEARSLAAEKLAEAAKGGDPSADRKSHRGAITVSELCEWYLKSSADHIKASTLAMDRSRISCHVVPLLGSRTVAGITLADLEKFQSDIASGKTALPKPRKGRTGKPSGGRGVASRTVGMLGTIFEFAKRNGVIGENPAKGVRRYPDEKRNRFLSNDELSLLGKRMNEALANGENSTAIAAILSLLLTGCRRVEVLSLKPGDLDTENQCLRLQDTKSGPQVRPIGKAALIQLKGQQERTSSSWIFPATRGTGHFVGLPKVLERICKGSSLSDISLHTLRHTHAATAASLGFTELTIAGLLGHRARGITQRYAHVADKALLSAADAVSAKISELIGSADAASPTPQTSSRELSDA